MKTNIFYLTLFFCLNAFTQINAQKQHTFVGCVVDQEGNPLIYADIKYGEDKNIQTDVDGCYHFEYGQATIIATVSYPGYLQKETTIESSEEQVVILNLWENNSSPGLTATKYVEREVAGDHSLEGVVMSEDKEPLFGVNVFIVDGSYGTVTDMDGKFKLSTPDKCNDIAFRYIGFENQDSHLCAGEEVSIKLKESAVSLDEVMVTSMGASRKKRRGRKSSAAAPTEYSYAVADDASPPPTAKSTATPKPAAVRISPETYEEVVTEAVDISDGVVSDAVADYEVEKDSKETLPDAGQLTAGEVNDFSKWDMWEDISQEDLAQHRSVWKQFADHRYTLQLTTRDGLPIVNAPVQLNDGQGNVIWRARTNNSGQAEMWAHYFLETERAANGLSITGTVDRRSFEIPNAKPFKEGINFHKVKAECIEQPIIDIAFVVDATGSMGDEIAYLQSELLNVIGRISDSLPAADVQTASIFYKDKSDNYLTKVHAFDKNAESTVKFIQGQSAGGGGDFPEAVDDAMDDAVNKLAWRDEATTRILFLVLDAPPHQNEDNIKRMQVAVTKAATMGIQIIPVACSGINKSTEYLMRSMALATNGTYTFITDHSGIGNAHIEPSTDDYKVEFLNDVMVRLGVDRSRLQACEEAPIASVDTTPFSIDGGEDGENWSYYPNPTTGPVNFKFDNNDGILYLSDAHGKLLQRIKAEERLELDLGFYPAGTYWLKHQDAEGNWTQGQVILVRR